MSKLQICKQSCNQCLFTANKIVSEDRAAEVVEQSLASDTYFECHKGTIAGLKLVCRGFWNKHKKDTLLLRLANLFGHYEFVEIPKED